jgi:hypothetical protein
VSQDPTADPPTDPSTDPSLTTDAAPAASAQTNPAANQGKDVEDWVTGDEPMTGPQRSYLETLAREAGEDVPDDLTKAQASQLIDRLQSKTGRGQSTN